MLQGYFEQTGSSSMVATIDAAKSVFGKEISSFVSSTLGKVTIVGTTIAAIVAGIKLMDEELNLSYETSMKHTEDAISKFKNTKSEIDDVNSKVENYKTTLKNIGDSYNVDLSGVESIDGMIQRINATGQVSLIDQSELSKISLANSSLERTLKLKQQAYTLEQKAAADLAKETLSKETKNEAVNSERTLGMKYNEDYYNNMTNNSKYKYGDLLESVQTDIKAVDDYKKKIEKLNEEKTKAEISELDNSKKKSTPSLLSWIESKNKKSDKLQKEIDDYSATIDKIQSDVTSKETELSTLLSAFSIDGNGTEALSGYEKEFNAVKNALDSISSSTLSGSEKAISKLNSYFSSSSGSSMKQYLEDIVKNGGTAEEALEAFRASGMRLKDIGVSENAFVRYFEDIKREAQEADEAVKSVDGTFDGLKKSFESENQGANYDTTMGYYKTAKEMYKNGLVGTDDFKSMAQFGVGYDIAKKLKDNADAYTYASDAYVEAWEQSQALLERWYGNEDELTNMTNVLNDFKDAGLASSLGDNEWTFKNDDGSMKFKTTAEAADKLNTSVSNVELAMSKLEEHGFEFDGIEKSGELLENYKNSLDQIKDVYDSMEDGAQKDRLKKLIEGYDSEYEKFQDDLSGLSEDQIVKIKFEYDLASIQQKIQELKSMAEASGSNQDQAALRVTQEQALGMLEGKTGVTKDSDEGYAQSYAKKISLTKDMAGKSEEERAAINQEINALLELQNAFQQFKLDGGELDWNSFLDTPTATALFNDLIEKGTLTEKQIKELFGDSITCKIDAELNDDNLQKKLASLKTDEKITFEADVDDLDNAQVEAVKNQDGTIKYTANVAGVPKEVHKITEQDGTIRFTTEFDGSLDWINNNLKNGETITYKADVSGIQKDIEACKDENGTIHYYSVMDDGSKQELTQQTDKDGKITYVADTSEVENAVKNTESQNPKVKVELTPDEQRVQDALKSLLNDQTKTTFSVDADFSKVKDDINALEVGHSIVFTANVDGVDQAVAAVKYQDGSIGYIANVDGVYYQLSAVQNTDGTVSYTIGNYPTEVPNANQTIDRTPNNSQVSKSPSSVGQTVNRTPNNSGILHAPTIVQKVIRFFTGGDKLLGTAHASGTLSDSSNLKDSWKTKKDEVALTGEVGEELVVSGNRWFTTGSNGAEFANIPAGSVVFNSKQTKELLSQGFTKSRGKGNPSLPGLPAFLEGTAYASGGRLPSSSSSSSSSTKKQSSSSSSSSRNSGSSSSSSSSSNSSSSSADDASEKVIDWIETLLSRVKRITDLAVNSIDRAIGLVNKQVKAADAISKVQAEIGANQEAAQAYLNKANSIDLSDVYKEKIMNGELTVETINDETLQKNIEDYKSYYESYLSAMDNVLDLEDQLTELAEKRLSIIEDQYDAIGDLKEAIKSGQEENRTLLENLGTSINSDANKNSLKQSITAQSQLYSSLTKKLKAYEAEVESQLKSGLMKKGSEQWYNAQKNIQEFATNITKASSELIELQDKLRQIQYDVLQNSIDSYARQTNKMNTYIDLLGAQDRQVPENLYQQQIKLNNNQIAKQYNLRAKYKKEQEKYDVNSKRYQELAEKINDADIEILNLRKDNEELKDSIFELRFTNIDKAIQKYSDLEDELSNFRDLLNDDAFVDKQGGITDEGLANIALLSQSIGNAKQKIADYTTGLTKLYEAYKNGTISADEYNEKAQEYRKGIQEATKDVKSYQNSLTDLYMKAMQTEIDYLGKIIDKRKKALSQQKEAYEFSKKVNSQSKDINSLKAQYEAIKNSNNLADKAKAKQLAAQIKEKEEELADTKRDHEYDMRSQGYDKMSDELSELLENTEYEISHNADKQLEIINSMLDKEVASYEAAYAKINSIIRETGFNGSSDFRNEQKELSTEQGAQNQKNEATQSQVSANKKPSSVASGTKTDKIYEGKSQNDKITQEILKPEETKRKVAELTVDKTSVSLEEGKSIGIKTSVRPNDAANKTLSWTSSNTSIATASNGTIKALKPGSCTITVATTDGSGISKTIGATVTKKPEPPKPAKKPTASTSNGKDGILRVGDTATLSGRYYYDSWGKRPAGNKYAGVQNGVTVDSYTSSEYGGNGKSTGDYKVHIGGTDGVYKDLGWVRPDQLSGYKNGIERVPYDQVAEINEGNKDETIITPKGHTLTLLTRNSSVLKNEAQKTLWDIANNPQLFAKNLITENLVSSMPQGFGGVINDVKLPDVTTKNQSIVFNLNDLVNIEQMTNTDLPDLQTIIEKSYDNMVKRTTQEARKLGIKRTR